MAIPKLPVIQSLAGAYSGRRTHYKAYSIAHAKLILLKKELGSSLGKFIAAVDELERVIRNEQ